MFLIMLQIDKSQFQTLKYAIFKSKNHKNVVKARIKHFFFAHTNLF